MNYVIRAAFFALSLATITPVANAAVPNTTPVQTQDDSTSAWANG